VAQGYHISRPVPAVELARWVRAAEGQGSATTPPHA